MKSGSLKQAVIIAEPGENRDRKIIETEAADGKKIFLAEQEYTDEELKLFQREREK